MAERHVAMQATETKWEALRRIVATEIADYDEAAGIYAGHTGIDPDGSARAGLTRYTAKADAARYILRSMDDLERQERDENGEASGG